MVKPNESQEKVPAVKYPHPKVLLVDVEAKVAPALSQAGFNVQSATFGIPYSSSDRSGNLTPVSFNPSISEYTEQEVVIVDLTVHPPPMNVVHIRGSVGGHTVPVNQPSFWVSAGGLIDPRPLGWATPPLVNS
jgi:hypothetical protein